MSNILARKSFSRKLFGVDMDPRKIGVARKTALAVPNATFELGNLLDVDYPQAEALLLVDTLHYWAEEAGRILQRFRYPTGLCIAILGPDGAGKTTVIRILCGLTHADSGSFNILGSSGRKGIKEIRKNQFKRCIILFK